MMCISFWSTQNSLGYRLILASNRDEFFHRPSAPANWHSFQTIQAESQTLPTLIPSSSATSFQLNLKQSFSDDGQNIKNGTHEILSGRDLIAGGTWLGICKKNGKFGFLTNITPLLDVPKNNGNDEELKSTHSRSELSRGNLIRDFLLDDDQVDNFINTLNSNDSIKRTRGFNVIFGLLGKTAEEEDKLVFFSNRDPDANYNSITNNQDHRDSPAQSTLVCGISNGIAGQPPIWPKVSFGINLMENCLKSQVQQDENPSEIDQKNLEQDLFNLLSQTDDSTDYIPSNILVRPQHRLSSPNTEISYQTWYGTRTQTIVLVSRTTPTKVTFVERDAFHIDLKDQSEDNLGNPVWLGDDRSRWRRFEFELSS